MQNDVGVQNAKEGIAKNMLKTRSPIYLISTASTSFHHNILHKDNMSAQYNYTTPVGC